MVQNTVSFQLFNHVNFSDLPLQKQLTKFNESKRNKIYMKRLSQRMWDVRYFTSRC